MGWGGSPGGGLPSPTWPLRALPSPSSPPVSPPRPLSDLRLSFSGSPWVGLRLSIQPWSSASFPDLPARPCAPHRSPPSPPWPPRANRDGEEGRHLPGVALAGAGPTPPAGLGLRHLPAGAGPAERGVGWGQQAHLRAEAQGWSLGSVRSEPGTPHMHVVRWVGGGVGPWEVSPAPGPAGSDSLQWSQVGRACWAGGSWAGPGPRVWSALRQATSCRQPPRPSVAWAAGRAACSCPGTAWSGHGCPGG